MKIFIFPVWLRSGLLFLVLSFSLSGHSATTTRTGLIAANENNYPIVLARLQASQFLSQASFGPTRNSVEQLANRIVVLGYKPALEEWIDGQRIIPKTFQDDLMRNMLVQDGVNLFDGANHNNSHGAYKYRYHAWWHTVLTAPDQLNQRIAWALSQIFVINDEDDDLSRSSQDNAGIPRYLGPSMYYDLLLDHSFSNYPSLLYSISTHPVMGHFLSHVNNPAPVPEDFLFPDENYAREIMQLFSIGLYELDFDGSLMVDNNGNLIETYSNQTIRELARVFTGWRYAASDFYEDDPTWSLPMEVESSQHDMGEKDLTELRNGRVLPAGQTAEQDLSDVINILTTHPNTAPFIVRRLIQRFTMSNPSPEYIQEIANVFVNTQGDFFEVIKALLLSDHNLLNYSYEIERHSRTNRVTGIRVINGGTERTRVIEPLLRFTAFLRLFNVSSDDPLGRLMLPDLSGDIKQSPYRAPSVFNFYLPDYQPSGDITNYSPDPNDVVNGKLYSPEFQIINSLSIVEFADVFRHYIIRADRGGVRYRLDYNSDRIIHITPDFHHWETVLQTSGARAMFDQLNFLLCGGNIDFTNIRTLYGITRQEASRNNLVTDIVKGSILAMVESPECIVR